MKGTQKYIIIGVGAALLLALLIGILSTYRRVDWQPDFTETEKKPYGAYLVYELADHLFPVGIAEIVEEPAFERLVFEHFEQHAYVFFNPTFPADSDDLSALLAFVRMGNDVFVAADVFYDQLLDSLDLGIGYAMPEGDSIDLVFDHPSLKDIRCRYHHHTLTNTFVAWDEASTTVLGHVAGTALTTFVRVQVGAGSIYLSTTPSVLSNYYMVHPRNHTYISGLLSHLSPHDTLLWDAYYKVDNLRRKAPRETQRESPSLLSYIMEQRALRWGFGVILAAMLFYAVFESKRTQRIIPVHRPLPNTTLDFTRTVGQLYYQSRDHRNIGEKKIKVLLEYIRTRYYLPTQTADEAFVQTLVAKSGIVEADVRSLFRQIDAFRRQEAPSENELVELSDLIEAFYREAAR
ncbi:MAG: hypothetical protein OHK0039_12160 [Bacteroidia bacterium]